MTISSLPRNTAACIFSGRVMQHLLAGSAPKPHRIRLPGGRAAAPSLARCAHSRRGLGLDEIRSVLGMFGEPLGRALHRLFVVLVDELVDRTLEPLPRDLGEVVPLFERELRSIGTDALELHLARLVLARLTA